MPVTVQAGRFVGGELNGQPVPAGTSTASTFCTPLPTGEIGYYHPLLVVVRPCDISEPFGLELNFVLEGISDLDAIERLDAGLA
jgi:hypothetical protein